MRVNVYTREDGRYGEALMIVELFNHRVLLIDSAGNVRLDDVLRSDFADDEGWELFQW